MFAKRLQFFRFLKVESYLFRLFHALVVLCNQRVNRQILFEAFQRILVDLLFVWFSIRLFYSAILVIVLWLILVRYGYLIFLADLLGDLILWRCLVISVTKA